MKLESGRPSKKRIAKDIDSLKEKEVRTTIVIPKSLHKKIKAHCANNELSMKEVIIKFAESLD